MDGVEEVIRIQVLKFDKLGRAHWAGMYGQPHTGEWRFPSPDLTVDDELVVALEWRLTAWVPTRIVDAGGRSIIEPEPPSADEEECGYRGSRTPMTRSP
jgi:hypothetical protein